MKTKISIVIAGVLLCLPCLRAQSLQAELEALQKRRLAALDEAITPLDRKFAEAADQLAARAAKAGDTALAERIRKERDPKTLEALRPNRFENSFWKMTEGAYVSIYCFHADGVLEEVSYQKSNGRPMGEKLKWKLVDDTHATTGKFSFAIENNVLSRNDGYKWTPADEESFKKCTATDDMKEVMRILEKPTKSGGKPAKETPFGR